MNHYTVQNLVVSVYGILIKAYPGVDQISHSVVSDSLRPHESQHARPPCPSPTSGVLHFILMEMASLQVLVSHLRLKSQG